MEDNIASRNSLVTLTDDYGNEHDFAIIDLFEVDEIRYAIMLPVFESEEEGEEPEVDFEEDAYIFRVETDEQVGEELFFEVEDEKEWEKGAVAWESRLKTMDEEETDEDDYF